MIPTVQLLLGDSRERLKELQDNSLDSCVTDPPYDLVTMSKRMSKPDAAPVGYGTDGAFQRVSRGFMGQTWDATGIAFDPSFWREVYRVLKPGAYLVAFGGTRTYHRMACAIEDAGFEIRDSLHWVYGSGFPKSRNVEKAIDNAAGAEREITGVKPGHEDFAGRGNMSSIVGLNSGTLSGPGGFSRPWMEDSARVEQYHMATGPATDLAKLHAGKGTALKPAHEPIILARKPFATISCTKLHEITSWDHWHTRRIATRPRNRAEYEALGYTPIMAVPPDVDAGDDDDGILTDMLDELDAQAPAPQPKLHFIIERKRAMHPGAESIVLLHHADGVTELARETYKRWSTACVEANVLVWGTGGLNIDAARIGFQSTADHGHAISRAGEPGSDKRYTDKGSTNFAATPGPRGGDPTGRWPANILMGHSPECERIGTKQVRNPSGPASGPTRGKMGTQGIYSGASGDMGASAFYGGEDGLETVDAWHCVPGCPVADMDEQSGVLTSGERKVGTPRNGVTDHLPGLSQSPSTNSFDGSTGGASRYFAIFAPDDEQVVGVLPDPELPVFIYQAKASKADRDAGLDAQPTTTWTDGRQDPADFPKLRDKTQRKNSHPTVKPTALMAYLVRLVTPLGGTTVDPFMGSGSTGRGAVREGRSFVGIELGEDYYGISVLRIDDEVQAYRRRVEQPTVQALF